MELTGGQTVSVSRGINLASTEANIPDDKQVNTVLHEPFSLGEVCYAGIPAIFLGLAGGSMTEAFNEASNSPIYPMVSIFTIPFLFFSVGTALFHARGKVDYLDDVMDTLGVQGKEQRKDFVRAFKKLSKNEAVTFVSSPDENGNVSVWKLENKQFSLVGTKNSGEDWDNTLENIKAVYSLRKKSKLAWW